MADPLISVLWHLKIRVLPSLHQNAELNSHRFIHIMNSEETDLSLIEFVFPQGFPLLLP